MAQNYGTAVHDYELKKDNRLKKLKLAFISVSTGLLLLPLTIALNSPIDENSKDLQDRVDSKVELQFATAAHKAMKAQLRNIEKNGDVLTHTINHQFSINRAELSQKMLAEDSLIRNTFRNATIGFSGLFVLYAFSTLGAAHIRTRRAEKMMNDLRPPHRDGPIKGILE